MKKYAFLLLILTFALGMIACSDSGTKPAASGQPGVEEAVGTAVDAYVYGYPLVTMDMTRPMRHTRRWDRFSSSGHIRQ
jgi:hypothetical protein